ncbi:MAG: laccase domain-containing protein, partial [Firmicutes bacterium]|nr:laccase domain-containing protein [Bacillota bacterium]
MIERMQSDFDTAPADLLAAIGPSIGPCCFEVGADVAQQFAGIFPRDAQDLIRKAETEGKYYVNLWEANRRTLMDGGVLPENITVTDVCTACHADVFHSYRKTKSPGRMAAILELV